MKNYILIYSTLILQCCTANNLVKSQNIDNNFAGIYKIKDSGRKLELNSQGFYTLYNPESFGHLASDFCDYSSKGQWKKISNDVIDLTSENYYLKQEGFEYELSQEMKLSGDSIYINIELPKDIDDSIPTPEFNILFNYNTSKQIITNNKRISISKKEYSLVGVKNQITLDLVFSTKGDSFFKNRLRYNILQDFPIDVEKYNFFTIKLPNFDKCFYDFEPYYHSNIFIKDKNILFWQGEEWIKQK